MPSVFDLFGTINLDTRNFDNSVRKIESDLKSADAQLNKTISTSNKLGDTSATVARRYEKLGDGIEEQRQRLLANALAFEKGDITAKQFGNTIVSVDKQVAGLNSRLKDAAARATELSETGGTHFQNQIGGAIEKQHSLINLNAARPLQGLGPVLQGLGLRQYGLDETLINILIVAAREAGILKVAQQGTAVATTAAAAAETEFAVAAKAAAVAEGEVAVATESTAVAAGQAAASVTLFGVGLLPLVAVSAAIAASGFAIYKVSEDIRSSAEKRLKTEEDIEGAFNRQYLAVKQLKDELAGITFSADLADFIKNSGTGQTGTDVLKNAQTALQQQYDENAKSVTGEMSRRYEEANRLGLSGNSKIDYINKAVPQGFTESQKAIADEIKALASGVVGLRGSVQEYKNKYPYGVANQFAVDTANFGTNSPKYQEALAKQQEKAAAEAHKLAEANKRAAEEAQRAAEKWKQTVEKLGDANAKRFGTNLEIADYQQKAREFRQGYRDTPGSTADEFQKKLDALFSGVGTRTIISSVVSGGSLPTTALFRQIADTAKLSDKDRRSLNEQIIKASTNVDPAILDERQRQIVANAFQQEATDLKKDEIKAMQDLTDVLKSGNVVTIKDETNGRVDIAKKATPAATAERYQ